MMIRCASLTEDECIQAAEIAQEVLAMVRPRVSPKVAASALRALTLAIEESHGFQAHATRQTFVTESGQEIRL